MYFDQWIESQEFGFFLLVCVGITYFLIRGAKDEIGNRRHYKKWKKEIDEIAELHKSIPVRKTLQGSWVKMPDPETEEKIKRIRAKIERGDR